MGFYKIRQVKCEFKDRSWLVGQGKHVPFTPYVFIMALPASHKVINIIYMNKTTLT